MKKSKARKNFKRKSKSSNIQHRHVVAPKDYRKPKYMRDPNYQVQPTTTFYPDRKINIQQDVSK